MIGESGFRQLKLTAAIGLLSAASTAVSAAQIEEIVVTAQKRAQNLQDVPISVDVLQKNELASKAISDAVDLAVATPSVVFQQGFGPVSNNFVIRGIGSFALEGGIQPSVSFVLDGVPLARVGEFVADLGDIERVEILRGPQGTLYGRNATAGVVNIVRSKPTEEFEGYLEQVITDDEEYTTRLMLNGGLTDSMRGRISATYKDRGDYIDNIAGPDLGGERTKAIMGKLDIDISSAANLLLTAEYSEQKSGVGAQHVNQVEDGIVGQLRLAALGNGDPVVGQSVVDDQFKVSQDLANENYTETAGISADLTIELRDGLVLKSISSYREINYDTQVDVDDTPANGLNTMNLPVVSLGTTNVGPNGDEYPIGTKSDYFSQEFRLEGSSDKLQWVSGVFYNHYTEQPKSDTPFLITDPGLAIFSSVAAGDGIPAGNNQMIFTNPRDPEATWDSYAIFGDLTYQLTDTVEMFGGLRWTMEDLDVDVRRGNLQVPNDPRYVTITADRTEIDTELFFADLAAGEFDTDIFYAGLAPVTGLGVIPGAAGYGWQRPAGPGPVVFSRSDRSEDWSGRLGLSWDVQEDLNLYGSVSRGFVGAGTNHGRNSTPENVIVDPSTTESIEVGIKSTLFDNSVRLNAAVFAQTVDDLQTSRLIPGTVESETFNAGTLNIKGLELNATWAATDYFTLDASLSYLDSEIDDLLQPCHPDQSTAAGCNISTDGDPTTGNADGNDQQDVSGNEMVLTPELSYSLSARFDLPVDAISARSFFVVSYTWQDDVQYNLTYDPLTVQESYGLVDISLGLEDNEGRYQVLLFGKNVTDEYFDNGLSNAINTQGRLLGRPGRGSQAYYGAKVKYNF